MIPYCTLLSMAHGSPQYEFRLCGFFTTTSLHLQVTPNLYGNLVANAAAGIAGGTGVMPGGRYLS